MISKGTPVYTSVKVTKGKHKDRAGKVLDANGDDDQALVELDASADADAEQVYIAFDSLDVLR